MVDQVVIHVNFLKNCCKVKTKILCNLVQFSLTQIKAKHDREWSNRWEELQPFAKSHIVAVAH